jgi:hypothetical protein
VRANVASTASLASAPSPAGQRFVRARALRHLPKRVSCLVPAVLAACLLPATSALAWNTPPHPTYSLSIVEGETTLPEYPILSTSGHVEPEKPVAVSIVRNGTVVARNVDANGNAGMSQVPQAGDVVTLESPIGTTVGAVVYDGLPSMDPTVCAGSTNFSGHNSPGETVRGGYFTERLHLPYWPEQTNFGTAQVTMLSGTSFGGSFLSPLAIGETVYAVESLETPLAGGAVFKYSSEIERPVGACPPPPPPAAVPPPPPPALQGSVLKLSRITIRQLLRRGWLDRVTINQPGTVVQDLYLAGSGRLPAFASSHKGRRHNKPKPLGLLLAHGSTSAASAGTVSVSLHITPKGRRKLAHARRVRAVLITTLRAASGAELNLERRTLTLHR